jgi:superfamily II DNA or RNA helicase
MSGHQSESQQLIHVPPKFYFSKSFGKNQLRQLKFPASTIAANGSETVKWNNGEHLELYGKNILVSKTRRTAPPDGFDDVLCISEGNGFTWSKQNDFADLRWDEAIARRQEAIADLRAKFRFIEEERNADLSIKTPGLRPPQIGAVYSALGFWKMSSDVATIVMPTGTGKTDSMVALMALEQPKCLLVVVPTDALRAQLAAKFQTYGVLTQFGLLPLGAAYPVVGVLKSGFENTTEIKTFCDSCNVIVTTMPLLGRFSELDQRTLAECCSHLFIDEAHHVRAATWNRLRSRFAGRRVLQFTATPYRNDGQHVDGKIVFNYSVRRAQQEGYFKKIILREVWDYVDPDRAVAEAAVAQLKTDLSNGLDHVVMARVSSIAKAEHLKAVYDKVGSKFSSVVVHSELTQKELANRMSRLSKRESRIAICVAMFGEGFDFPELKIAALHDIHQSLAVTIQFTGRFTRANPKVGDATIIVNRAVAEINDSVRELYAQGEGADWNHVLSKLTEGATENQIDKETFYQSFGVESPAVPIQNVAPKMSTVVYRTNVSKWTPWQITDLPMAKGLVGDLSVSVKENTAYFITHETEPVQWADASDLRNQTFDLYALFWDPETKLLYVNSSNNDSVHEELAKAVGGPDATLISGVDAFRVLHGIRRLLLRNAGLNDRLRRSVRFMMFTGADIQAFLDSSQSHGKEKTHVFGDGFDGKSRVTMGTSKKGRVWSWQEAKDLLEWKKWCVRVGAKLIDSSIEPDSFLQDSMVPEDISGPPALHPLTIEWPDDLYERTEESTLIGHGALRVPFFEVGLDLIDPAPSSAIRFKVFADEFSASYRLKFGADKVTYVPEAEELVIRVGRRNLKLSDFFNGAHPIIRYEQDCFSRGDQLLKPRQRKLHIFNAEKIKAWVWDGVDLTKESQTLKKRKDSIQYRTIDTISSPDWDRHYQVIFDDDAPGEAADVVALALSDQKLMVDLFHCKFTADDVGKRVKDLHEVCGQAQRSIKWRENVDRFLVHLLNRERKRMTKCGVSRFERGDFKQVQEIRTQARALLPEFRIFIVQPGVSKSKVSDGQRELLGSTELYLYETFGIEFGVIASA